MFTSEQITLFQRVLARQSEVESLMTRLDAIDVLHSVDADGMYRRSIRVRPEPADRSLEEETRENQEVRDYHARRAQEEIASRNQRCEARCAQIAEIAARKVDQLEYRTRRAGWKGCQKDADAKIEALKIEAESKIQAHREYNERLIEHIPERRELLSWTCPNDGRAYGFEWENQHFLRTYSGEIWRDAAPKIDRWTLHHIPVLGEWCGQWTGHYITSAPLIMDTSAVGARADEE